MHGKCAASPDGGFFFFSDCLDLAEGWVCLRRVTFFAAKKVTKEGGWGRRFFPFFLIASIRSRAGHASGGPLFLSRQEKGGKERGLGER